MDELKAIVRSFIEESRRRPIERSGRESIQDRLVMRVGRGDTHYLIYFDVAHIRIQKLRKTPPLPDHACVESFRSKFEVESWSHFGDPVVISYRELLPNNIETASCNLPFHGCG